MKLLVAAFLGAVATAVATPLDDYVNTPDEHYQWEDLGLTMNGTSLDGKMSWNGYLLNMTSQKWLDEDTVTRSLWWHIMLVVVPSTADVENDPWSFLWITGGSNDHSGIPSQNDEDVQVTAQLAMTTGTIATALFQVPNEHLMFYDDPIQKSRSEDAIIAYGWNKFITAEAGQRNPQYLLRLPMTKAAVRAMDTVEEFTSAKFGTKISKWGVAGASKRGWTTWTVGAVDDRVQAIMPLVMDLLKVVDNIHRMYEAYGGFSFALKDYLDEDFAELIDTDGMAELATIVDPYSYIDRFTMPVFMASSGNDEFFLGDNSRMWFHDLPGENNHMILLPNTEHSLATGIFEILPAISVWVNSVKADSDIPNFEWTIDDQSGDITVTTETDPAHVHMWYANTYGPDGRRDFRILNADDPCKCGFEAEGYCANLHVLWQSKKLHEDSPGVYTAHRDPEEGKYTAFFIDMVYDVDNSTTSVGDWPIGHYKQFEFTTEMSIIPVGYPFPPCVGGVNCTAIIV